MKLNLLRDGTGKFTKVPFDPSATTRVCSTCKAEKPIGLFGPDKTGIGGVKNKCRKCESEASSRYNRRNPEKTRAHRRALTLRRKGLTVEQYSVMFAEQGFSCAICGTEKNVGRGTFHVDHCHMSEQVRGILCNKCNSILGYAGDSIEVLEKAIAYLRNSNSRMATS